MKLLDKKTISQQRSNERKMEIDEGIKLAKKIDTLRETASKEEQNLANFRQASLDVIHTEIRTLTDEKHKLIEEIMNLKHKIVDLEIEFSKKKDIYK